MLQQFDEQEVCELVNRCLYQLEYNTTFHKKRQQQMRELEAPAKAAFKKLFPGESWAKATPEQIAKAVQIVKEEQ